MNTFTDITIRQPLLWRERQAVRGARGEIRNIDRCKPFLSVLSVLFFQLFERKKGSIAMLKSLWNSNAGHLDGKLADPRHDCEVIWTRTLESEDIWTGTLSAAA